MCPLTRDERLESKVRRLGRMLGQQLSIRREPDGLYVSRDGEALIPPRSPGLAHHELEPLVNHLNAVGTAAALRTRLARQRGEAWTESLEHALKFASICVARNAAQAGLG